MSTSSPAEPPSAARVLCVGDMTADVFAQGMARLPGPGEVGLTERILFCPGGNALNTAVALRRLGEPVRFVGCVGDDAFGDLLLAELRRLGLDLQGVVREHGCPTPTTLIYRAEGEDRRFVHAVGAGDRFTGRPVPVDLIPTDGVVLAAGYLKLRAWTEAALEALLREARRRGCTTVLNVCLPGGVVHPGACLGLLPLVDVFVPNEDEARMLTGETDPRRQTRALRDAGVRLAVVTRGSHGLYAEDRERTVEMGAFDVPLVDPSGCGDCFTAGLIAGLLRAWDLPQTLRFASALGALGAAALGCTSGVPRFADAERFALEHALEIAVTAHR